MKVRMKTILAGPAGNAQPGQVVEVGAEMGQALMDAGFAEAIEVAVPELTAEGAVMSWLMGLTVKQLKGVAAEMNVELDDRPRKADIAEALARAGVALPQEGEDDPEDGKPQVETASLGAGETAANTEQPQPRRRTPAAN